MPMRSSRAISNYNGAIAAAFARTLTFALVKEPRGWLISAFAWTGPVATL